MIRGQSKVPALLEIDKLAQKYAKNWMRDADVKTRVGEEEFAFRMFRAVARAGREIGKREVGYIPKSRS